jgi:membrane protease YdiL (CAAX protease family)
MRLMSITSATTAYILSLNGIAALVFGYLYWQRGLGSAMLAHFLADLVLRVIGPMVIKGPSA